MKKKVPKDLGLRVATKEEAYWESIKEDTEKQIESVEKQLKFLRAVLDMATIKIKLEQ
jgi:hypothetical protein